MSLSGPQQNSYATKEVAVVGINMRVCASRNVIMKPLAQRSGPVRTQEGVIERTLDLLPLRVHRRAAGSKAPLVP